MQVTIANPQKGWLETSEVEFSDQIRPAQPPADGGVVCLPGRSLRTWQPEDYQQFAVFKMRADF
jgi:hypothetical protein